MRELNEELRRPEVEAGATARFNPAKMSQLQIYPGWQAGNQDKEWLMDAFQRLRDFYSSAATQGRRGSPHHKLQIAIRYRDSAARLSTTHERITSDFAARSPERFGYMMPFDRVTRTSSEFALPACTTRITPA